MTAKNILSQLRNDLSLGVVDTKMVGWELVKKRNVVKFFPTIRIVSDNAEARLLLEKKLKSSTIKNGVIVKYLGVSWDNARKLDYIPASRWEPIHIGENPKESQTTTTVASKRKNRGKAGTEHQLDDAGRLANFLHHIENTARFKKDPDNLKVNLKVEELYIRRIWETVLKQQMESDVAKKQEEKKRANMQYLAPVLSKHDTPVATSFDESDDDDDEDGSFGQETTIEALVVGDRIEFFDPLGVAGNPMWLKSTTIMGIRRDNEYPLCTETLSLLPRSHHVRKLPDGCYRAIEAYQLPAEDQGDTNMSHSLNHSIAKLKRVRDDFNKATDDFWKNGQGETANRPHRKKGTVEPANT